MHRSVSIEELTNGAYTLQNPLDGNNLSCLGLIGGSSMSNDALIATVVLFPMPVWIRGVLAISLTIYIEAQQPTLIR